jgi:hypothetical protein
VVEHDLAKVETGVRFSYAAQKSERSEVFPRRGELKRVAKRKFFMGENRVLPIKNQEVFA